MGRAAAVLLSVTLLGACAQTVRVAVPPRMDLKPYGTIGIVDFATNYERTYGARAARQFQEQVQGGQPGTPFVELGDRDLLLASVGARQLDAAALKKIGEKHGVAAVFVGELSYSDPIFDVRVTDASKGQGGMRAEVKADISSRLVETATGASVWSRSAWAKRQIGGVSVSDQGVRAGMKDSNPREAMLPTLVYQLTHDFRPSTVRQPVAKQ